MVTVLRIEPDRSVVKEVVCRHCGATLQYIPNEVQSYHGRDYSGGADGYEWVNCPNCGGEAVVWSW